MDAEVAFDTSQEQEAWPWLMGLRLPGAMVARLKRDGTILQSNEAWLEAFGEPRYVQDVLENPRLEAIGSEPEKLTATSRHGLPLALVGLIQEDEDERLLIATYDTDTSAAAQNMATLASQLDDLHREAVRQREQLKHVTEDLRTMAFGIVHDLRGPLQHLEMEIGENVHIAKMRSLVHQLLEYARAGDVPYEPVEVDVNELCQRVMQPIVQDRAAVSFDSLPKVTGSTAFLETIFSNLTENSLRYEDGPLEIRVYAKDGIIYFADNGIGIKPEYAEKLFDMFSRFSTRHGHGLGLALCRRLVERMGGKIWAQPQSQGLRIAIQLQATT